jgi:electron transfer flavoprotein alpha subunit
LNIQDFKGIWVFAEQRDGKLAEAALEMLGGARKLAAKTGEEVAAVLLGGNISALAAELAAYGADKVYLADSPALKLYTNEAYAPVIVSLVQKHKPSVILLGGTSMGMDLAPRVAARLGTGLSAHAVDVDIDKDGCMIAHVPSFGGSVMASIACSKHRPQMSTIPAGFLQKPDRQPGRKAVIEQVTVQTPNVLRTRVVEVFHDEPKAKPLNQAEVVVAGGFGVGSKDGWKLVEELASTLGASVGATRPACDEGWANLEDQMIGQSGKTVRPKLYFGIGISGAMHHMIGLKDSKVIVAINNDEKAPIDAASDYVLLGDYKQIVPALVRELQEAKKK